MGYPQTPAESRPVFQSSSAIIGRSGGRSVEAKDGLTDRPVRFFEHATIPELALQRHVADRGQGGQGVR